MRDMGVWFSAAEMVRRPSLSTCICFSASYSHYENFSTFFPRDSALFAADTGGLVGGVLKVMLRWFRKPP